MRQTVILLGLVFLIVWLFGRSYTWSTSEIRF